MTDDDELVELPADGDVVWARTLGMATTVRCRIEGRAESVVFEFSSLKGTPFQRRVHRVEEIARTDTIGMHPTLGRLRRCDPPDDEALARLR